MLAVPVFLAALNWHLALKLHSYGMIGPRRPHSIWPGSNTPARSLPEASDPAACAGAAVAAHKWASTSPLTARPEGADFGLSQPLSQSPPHGQAFQYTPADPIEVDPPEEAAKPVRAPCAGTI